MPGTMLSLVQSPPCVKMSEDLGSSMRALLSETEAACEATQVCLFVCKTRSVTRSSGDTPQDAEVLAW